MYYLNIRPIILKSLSILFCLFSLLIIYGEFTIGITMSSNIFDYMLDITYSSILFNILSVLFFMILFYYCLVALFDLKLSGYYDINSNRETDAYSLFHLTLFICRVGFPLCLNFLCFFKKHLPTTLEEVIVIILI